MSNQKKIGVYAHWSGLTQPIFMGILKATPSRGKEIFSFEYDKQWIEREVAQNLDPDLQWFPGPQYLHDTSKLNFGIFLDSSPDRWGRVLMRRREAALAKSHSRPERKLYESDYLLGVFDAHRMGGLRFKLDKNGEFLDNNKHLASPPWTSLKELEFASKQLEQKDITKDPDYMKWLYMLLAPGGSLGGARPKASVLDENMHPWIAKFPSQADDFNVGSWEMVVYELAKEVGLNVPECKLEQYSSHHTFLTKRFDRTSSGERIHFASAMTMLGYTDRADYEDGVSYLDLAGFIIKNGSHVQHDLRELWQRIVFSICVSNTDDHLRNHGFLLTEGGWQLSPAFDINPSPTGHGLKLSISENDNALNIDLALEVSRQFRLQKDEANSLIKQTKTVVRQWDRIAKKLGIPTSERELMARAFTQAFTDK